MIEAKVKQCEAWKLRDRQSCFGCDCYCVSICDTSECITATSRLSTWHNCFLEWSRAKKEDGLLLSDDEQKYYALSV